MPEEDMDMLLVFTNMPTRESAEELARQLIDLRVAACVNLLAPCRSVYRWKDRVDVDEEHPMLIKTTRERYDDLESALRFAHPYEVPEIIALPVEAGLPDYLQWVTDETAERS